MSSLCFLTVPLKSNEMQFETFEPVRHVSNWSLVFIVKQQSVILLIVYYSSCIGDDYCQNTDSLLGSIT